MIRPQVRLPWYVLLTFAAVIYFTRSALRGWDFTPDLTDILVFGGLVLIVAVRPLADRWMSDADDDEDDGRGR